MLHAVTVETEVTLNRTYKAYVDDHGQPMTKAEIEAEARRIADEEPDELIEKLESDAGITSVVSVAYEGIVQTE